MEENWKVVRNRSCIRAIMIFIGVILMQMLAYIICVVVLTGAALFLGEKNSKLQQMLIQANAGNHTFMISVSVVSAILSIFWCGTLYRRSDWRERPFDYKKAFCGKNVAVIIGSGVGGCIVFSFLLTGLYTLAPGLFSLYNETMGRLTDGSMPLVLLYVLLIGPVSEELVFRGAIMDRLYLAFPFYLANGMQALLFGIYHLDWIQGAYAVCLGIVLGLLRRKTGSIFAGMAAHILFNTTSYVLGGITIENPTWRIVCMVIVFGLGGSAFLLSMGSLIGKKGERKETSAE